MKILYMTVLFFCLQLSGFAANGKAVNLDLSGCWNITNRIITMDRYEDLEQVSLVWTEKNFYTIDEEGRSRSTLRFHGNYVIFTGEGSVVVGDVVVENRGNVIILKNLTDIEKGPVGDLPIIEIILIRCNYVETWLKKHRHKIKK